MEDQLAQAPFREGVSGGETRRIVAPRTLRLPKGLISPYYCIL